MNVSRRTVTLGERKLVDASSLFRCQFASSPDRRRTSQNHTGWRHIYFIVIEFFQSLQLTLTVALVHSRTKMFEPGFVSLQILSIGSPEFCGRSRYCAVAAPPSRLWFRLPECAEYTAMCGWVGGCGAGECHSQRRVLPAVRKLSSSRSSRARARRAWTNVASLICCNLSSPVETPIKVAAGMAVNVSVAVPSDGNVVPAAGGEEGCDVGVRVGDI